MSKKLVGMLAFCVGIQSIIGVNIMAQDLTTQIKQKNMLESVDKVISQSNTTENIIKPGDIGEKRKINFQGDWTSPNGVMTTKQQDASFEYSFVGTGIEYWARKKADAAKVEIFIDRESKEIVDCYDAGKPGVLKLFDSGELEFGKHTLKVVLKEKNSHQDTDSRYPQEWIEVDKLVVESPLQVEKITGKDGEITLRFNQEVTGEIKKEDLEITLNVDGIKETLQNYTLSYNPEELTLKISYDSKINGQDKDIQVEAEVVLLNTLVKQVNYLIESTTNKAPIAKNVQIKPYWPNESNTVAIEDIYNEREMLEINYDFKDEDGDIEDKTKYQWYMSDTKDGVYEKITGIRGRTIILLEDYAGKYLKCEVTPVDERGKAGIPSMSELTEAPVKDIPNNPNTDWFKDSTYGVSHHFISNYILRNARGNEKWDYENESWSDLINTFDAKGYAKQCDEAGIGFVIFTLGQNSGYFCAPNETYDNYLREAGILQQGEKNPKTPERDLIMDVADALAEYDIKLMLYLPAAAPHSAHAEYSNFKDNKGDYRITTEVFGAPAGRDVSNPAEMTEKTRTRMQAIIKEWSLRYGDKVAGWWFDGMFDGRIYPAFNMNNEANIADLTNVTKAGNPDAIVSYSPGGRDIFAKFTPYDDYTYGENQHFTTFPNQIRWAKDTDDVQQYAFAVLGNVWDGWGGWGAPGISKDTNELVSKVQEMKNRQTVIALDTYVNRYGVLDAPQLEQLKEVKRIVKQGEETSVYNDSHLEKIKYYNNVGELDQGENWNYLINDNTKNYFKDVHTTSQKGASAVLTFKGGLIELFTKKTPDSGLADVYINGTLVKEINLESETEEYQTQVFEYVVEDPTQETTIKIVNKEDKPLYIDKFNVKPYIQVDGIKLDKEKVTMNTSADREFVSILEPSVEGVNVIITSSNDEVATASLDKSIIDIQAKGEGVTTIRIEDRYNSNVYKEIEVTVLGKEPVKLLDDTDESMRYSENGNWIVAGNRPADNMGYYETNRNIHATTRNGEYMEFDFEGTGIEVISTANSDQGQVKISIVDEQGQEVATELVDTSVPKAYPKKAFQVSIFSKMDLAKGKYTLRMEKIDGQYMIVDAFRIYQAEEVVKGIEIKLVGKNEVKAGEEFEVIVGIDNIKDAVYAGDMRVEYDSDVFDLKEVKSIAPTEVVGTKEDKNSVRILTGIEGGSVEAAELLRLQFGAKNREDTKEGTIRVNKSAFGTVVDGKEAIVNGDLVEKTILIKGKGSVITPPEDVNQDQTVDVADLALVAYYYQTTPDSDNWKEAKKADINDDKKVDIEDLSIIASKILEKIKNIL